MKNLGFLIWLAAAFGFRSISKTFEAQGDVAALAGQGEGLGGHLVALLFLLLALGCFLRAGQLAFRRIMGRPPESPAHVFADDESIEPARPLARDQGGQLPRRDQPPVASPPQAPRFGRKGL